jgi:hypothetical protein
MTLNLDFSFNDVTYRHTLNGELMVLHCHHYMTLYTKLAEEFAGFGGKRILAESIEDAMLDFFKKYHANNSVTTPAARLEVGKEFYSTLGLGLMEISGDENGGEIKLIQSHVDKGWIKKFGKHDKAVNHFSCGFAAAIFSAAFDKGPRVYDVVEATSIAMGNESGKLTVKRK